MRALAIGFSSSNIKIQVFNARYIQTCSAYWASITWFSTVNRNHMCPSSSIVFFSEIFIFSFLMRAQAPFFLVQHSCLSFLSTYLLPGSRLLLLLLPFPDQGKRHSFYAVALYHYIAPSATIAVHKACWLNRTFHNRMSSKNADQGVLCSSEMSRSHKNCSKVQSGMAGFERLCQTAY